MKNDDPLILPPTIRVVCNKCFFSSTALILNRQPPAPSFPGLIRSKGEKLFYPFYEVYTIL